MPLNCSSANRRSSYIQSCTSVRPSACVASTVMRLIRSLGNPGHRPVVMRPAPDRARGLDDEAAVVDSRSARAIRCSTDATTSMSAARAPRTSTAPPVTAATTAQLPASM